MFWTDATRPNCASLGDDGSQYSTLLQELTVPEYTHRSVPHVQITMTNRWLRTWVPTLPSTLPCSAPLLPTTPTYVKVEGRTPPSDPGFTEAILKQARPGLTSFLLFPSLLLPWRSDASELQALSGG